METNYSKKPGKIIIITTGKGYIYHAQLFVVVSCIGDELATVVCCHLQSIFSQKMQARLSTIKVTSFSVMGTMYSGLY